MSLTTRTLAGRSTFAANSASMALGCRVADSRGRRTHYSGGAPSLGRADVRWRFRRMHVCEGGRPARSSCRCWRQHVGRWLDMCVGCAGRRLQPTGHRNSHIYANEGLRYALQNDVKKIFGDFCWIPDIRTLHSSFLCRWPSRGPARDRDELEPRTRTASFHRERERHTAERAGDVRHILLKCS